ncbi:hypothetical protein JX819_002981, partial [Citrobacter farmeri]
MVSKGAHLHAAAVRHADQLTAPAVAVTRQRLLRYRLAVIILQPHGCQPHTAVALRSGNRLVQLQPVVPPAAVRDAGDVPCKFTFLRPRQHQGASEAVAL